METKFDRRSFLRVTGTALGIGALYSVFPALTHSAGAEGITRTLAELNGEAPAPFSFIQLSDTHVGFNGPPDPLGNKAFESAVATINGLKTRPELVIVTGDLTHDVENPDEHAKRFKLFKQIAGNIGGAQIKVVPGENDAGLDDGEMFRQFMGPPHYSFDHRGVHFIALDNVSQKGFGADQLAWLASDLDHATADAATKYIVVGMHKPLARNGISKHGMDSDGEQARADSEAALALLVRAKTALIFASHVHEYAQTTLDGIPFYITGGLGAPLVRAAGPAHAFHHVLQLDVAADGVHVSVIRFDGDQTLTDEDDVD